MRLRGYSDDVPKPMVQIGTRPILWHVMKYYAHFGHKDFILCLGYKGNSIKDYFLHYDESVSNDFVWSKGRQADSVPEPRHRRLDHHLRRDRGQRHHRRAAQGGGTVSRRRRDLPGQLQRRPERRASSIPYRELRAKRRDRLAAAGAAHGQLRYRARLKRRAVTSISPLVGSDIWINGGYFVLRTGGVRLYSPGRRTRARAVPAPDRQEGPAGPQVHRLLAVHGHVQGQAAPGRTERAGTPRPGRCGGRERRRRTRAA